MHYSLLQLVCKEWALHLIEMSPFPFDGQNVQIVKHPDLSNIATPLAHDVREIKVIGLKSGFDMVGFIVI